MTMVKTKSTRHKNSAIKQKLKFEDYKHSLEAHQPESKINQLVKTNLV